MAKAENLDDENFDSDAFRFYRHKAIESLAGLLAEAKFVAMQRLGLDRLRFNSEMTDFGDLLTLLESDVPEGTDQTIRLEFLRSDGGDNVLMFAGNEFLISRKDRRNFVNHASGRLVIRNSLCRRPNCWSRP